MKMEEAPPGDETKDHYNLLLEDINAIDFGGTPLPTLVMAYAAV